MPREVISIQVGQCGNQLGLKWWDVMLQEYKANPQYTDARDALFDVQPSTDNVGGGDNDSNSNSNSGGKKTSLKARCVSIDMEEGVLRSMLRGPLHDLFDANFFVSDVSGAGNNWAVGHMEYGDRYIDSIADTVRRQVERCESVQSFILMHSLSGGTGSGLGTRVLGMLEDDFPHVVRLCPVVVPGGVDDVVTAPYNTAFAMRELAEHADIVIPLDNDALARMADAALGRHTNTSGNMNSNSNSNNNGNNMPLETGGVPRYSVAQPTRTALPYDSMNALVAQMLSNLTCAMRFPGTLNMDVNELATNLVPFPRLVFITSALAPLCVARHTQPTGPRSVDAMFSACLERQHQFMDITHAGIASALTRDAGVSLATAVIARGPQITVGDLARNIPRLRERMRPVYWNEDGFKTALCGVSPLGHPQSLLMLSNHCSVAHKLEMLLQRFMRLYTVRSHVHHYEPYLEMTYFDSTEEVLSTIVDDYKFLNTVEAPKDTPRSMRDLVYF